MLQQAAEAVGGDGTRRMVMVDCSHANSQKQHDRQLLVVSKALRSLSYVLPPPRSFVSCDHAFHRSHSRCLRQCRLLRSVHHQVDDLCAQLSAPPACGNNQAICGVMIESHINAGEEAEKRPSVSRPFPWCVLPSDAASAFSLQARSLRQRQLRRRPISRTA